MLEKVIPALKGLIQWHIVAKGLQAAAAAILGILLDAGILDGQLHAAAVRVVDALAALLLVWS